MILFALSAGCSRPVLTEKDLTRYIMTDDNGLIKTSESGGYTIEVVYSPVDLVMVGELRELKTFEERQEHLKAYDTISYFLVRLSHKGREVENQFSSNPGMFASVVEYLGDGISADLTVVTETDTIPAMAVSYVRAFGMAGKTSLLCAFGEDLRNKTGTIKLVFADSKLGTGVHEFVFSTRNIKDVPLIKL
ncbi:MAG TPA: hypothetical protein VK508_02755 [Cyclobacteriaceae bacterium]|nr:hypothetical protein [Cyclobacteriaceae bacterium]